MRIADSRIAESPAGNTTGLGAGWVHRTWLLGAATRLFLSGSLRLVEAFTDSSLTFPAPPRHAPWFPSQFVRQSSASISGRPMFPAPLTSLPESRTSEQRERRGEI